MKAKENRNLLVVGAVLIVCLIVIGVSGSSHGGDYDVRPEITLPEHRTDAARAIDAYERVMDRLMNLTEKNLAGINTDVKDISKTLVLIDSKLTELSTRIGRIENALGIEQVEKTPDATNTDKPTLQNQN
ncbi:MAG: hypothetical protein WC476_04885 [Phycisphaerae bacterium]